MTFQAICLNFLVGCAEGYSLKVFYEVPSLENIRNIYGHLSNNTILKIIFTAICTLYCYFMFVSFVAVQ